MARRVTIGRAGESLAARRATEGHSRGGGGGAATRSIYERVLVGSGAYYMRTTEHIVLSLSRPAKCVGVPIPQSMAAILALRTPPSCAVAARTDELRLAFLRLVGDRYLVPVGAVKVAEGGDGGRSVRKRGVGGRRMGGGGMMAVEEGRGGQAQASSG